MVEVVAALIWEQDKFMICQRPPEKARGLLWEFPGGKVEPGETKQAALIRECWEELAVALRVGGSVYGGCLCLPGFDDPLDAISGHDSGGDSAAAGAPCDSVDYPWRRVIRTPFVRLI